MISFLRVCRVHPKDPAHSQKGDHDDQGEPQEHVTPALTLALTLALALALTLALTLTLTLTLALPLPLPLLPRFRPNQRPQHSLHYDVATLVPKGDVHFVFLPGARFDGWRAALAGDRSAGLLDVVEAHAGDDEASVVRERVPESEVSGELDEIRERHRVNARKVISDRAAVGKSDPGVTIAKLLNQHRHGAGVRCHLSDQTAVQALAPGNSDQSIPNVSDEISFGIGA